MLFLIGFIVAIVISMAIIPLMARLAPHIGTIDHPDPRKIHAVPIPRAGGVGIVLGALVPVAMWLPLDQLSGAFLFGALILLVFGVWDDIQELGHYVKFIGQFAAVIAVVYYGDLHVTSLPFMEAELPETTGKIFTVFAMVGMINAVNHSDGLDGLAGGTTLLSLSCIAYLASMADADGSFVVLIALAVLGGIVGFLRYNNHPARVFMGDGGSQFLGFTAAFLAVYLLENVNTVLSRALPALILGLPIMDILAVFAQRVYHGMNWFRASKNHVHHRLLALGFDHYESVVIIYSIQTLFVISAIFLCYESDALILSIYFGVCAALFVFLTMAEHRRWRAHRAGRVSEFARIINTIKAHRRFITAPVQFIGVAVPVLFIAVSLLAKHVPEDIGLISAVMAGALVLYFVSRISVDSIIAQAVHYVTAASVIYLETRHLGENIPGFDAMQIVYFGILIVAIGLAIRYGEKSDFRTTPMDYLVVIIALTASFVMQSTPELAEVGLMAGKLIVVFYACELIVRRMRRKWSALNIATFVSLAVLAYRGLV
jgi:UDP-GlcNAc:undecaprenyl-phosphate GlcNAc-1-phosphate transferase